MSSTARYDGVTTEFADTWGPEFIGRYLRKYEGRHTEAVSAAEASNAAKLAGTPRGGRVLDCPCGYGRHARQLARLGYQVTGSDQSTLMLELAGREGVAGREWAEGARPRWVRSDYRRLPFVGRSFDTVLNLFTSFGYYGDDQDRQVLAEYQRVLRPGGTLLIDATHRDRLVRSFEPERAVRASRDHSSFDIRTGWLEMIHRDDTDGKPTVSRIRIYSVTELTAMLTAVGFRRVRVFGGLDGTPLTWDTRMVAVATR
jgi:SAM-dependent methyltransferase